MREYSPDGIWCKHDFSINKHYWRKIGIASAYSIRINNLIDIKTILNEYGITNWLQGKTLLGIYESGKLLDDHDDDIGVFKNQIEEALFKVSHALENKGFRLIRNTNDIISFERDYRYIDICLFHSISSSKVGYSNKIFDAYHFNRFEKINWQGIVFDIPYNSSELLNEMYPLKLIDNYDSGSAYNAFYRTKPALLKQHFKKNITYLTKVIESPSLSIYCLKYLIKKFIIFCKRKKKYIYYLLYYLPQFIENMAIKLLSLGGLKITTLSKNDFLELYIEPNDSFNWKWRYRHLSLVTDSGKYRKIKDIINYLSSNDTRKNIDSSIEETDTSSAFFPPINYDMRFWWGGNNYFWYCVKYEFRKNVIPYSDVNNYIISNKKPFLYTKEYYRSLPLMSDREIRKLISTKPIEIKCGAITSGKHRAFAMIGRLLSGKSYIPFRADER